MANYFDEMGWQPLGEGETPNQLLHLDRLLRDYNFFELLPAREEAPPASQKVVENLKEITINNTGLKCVVCLKEFDKGEVVKTLPCKHHFHTECIVSWLSKTNSCPLCRYELETDDEDYEVLRKERMRAKQREAELEILHNSMFS